jgi:hypothetical protein
MRISGLVYAGADKPNTPVREEARGEPKPI